MVEKLADDGVEPKPAIIEASGDVKPTVNVNLKVKIPFQAQIEEKPKPVPIGVAKVRGNEGDTASFFLTNERWREKDDLLGWVRRQAERAGFTISIDKSSLKIKVQHWRCNVKGMTNTIHQRRGRNQTFKAWAQGNVNVRLGCVVYLIRIQMIGGLQCLVEFTTMSCRQS